MNPQLELMLQQAIQAFQSGDFDGADLSLRRILQVDSRNLPALHILGLIKASQSKYLEAADYLARAARIDQNDASIQFNLAKALADSGRDKEALAHHKKAVALAPNNPEAWLSYGKTASNLGRYEDALVLYGNALSLKSDYAEAALNKGATLKELKRCEEAIALAEQALTINPNLIEAWSNKGAVLQELKRYDEAMAHYDKAINLNPDYHEGWFNKGAVLQELKRYDEAMAHYDKAINLNPDYHEAWSNKGLALKELKRFFEAMAHYDKATSLNPNYHEGWFNKGATLHELKQYDEAMAHYDQVLSLKPDHREAWINKGLILQELKRYDEAMAHYDQVLSLKPDDHEMWTNKGLILQELKRYDEAMAHYDQVLSLKPDYAEGWNNIVMLNLFLKKYQAGWENYDWRLKTKDYQLKMAVESLTLWNGLSCKHLLIFSEQGIGDMIFYASMLGIAKNRTEKITVSIDVRLIPILSRSFPEITFFDNNAPFDASLYDAQIPFGSLPVVMNMNPDMVGRRIPYLMDNDLITKNLKNNSHSKKQLKCGVAWKSNNQKLGANKSILLSDLNDIFQADGFEFINLQYGDTQDEIKDLENNHGAKLTTVEGIDLFKDIDGLLSIIQTCDLVVTTSNVTAHLAGALGKTTFLLVPYSAGRIWYWHEETISSWYPSISLYSQDQNFEWKSAIKNIASRLKNEIFK
jgi:tetratricopeptide (TPR) repeat protein